MKPLSSRFSPDDYDHHGALRLPLWFWGVLVLQARSWILFVMAGASRQQGEGLLQLFYPDTQRFWFALRSGLLTAKNFVSNLNCRLRRHFSCFPHSKNATDGEAWAVMRV